MNTKLKNLLQHYDLVILVDVENADVLTDKLCKSFAFINTGKSLCVISVSDFPVKNNKHNLIKVTAREMGEILDLYRSYEASDKLIFLGESENYGGLRNYVRSDILSEEEMFEALLI